MKKTILSLFLIISSVIIFMEGCEQSTKLQTASFSEITAAGSDNYAVRVTFANDKRLDGKGVDVQVKFSKTGSITMWQENQEKFDYEITESDEWYSMTSIFTIKGNAENLNTEVYETHDKILTKTYLFKYEGKGGMEITLRAVVGDKQQNAYKTGEILVDSEPISDQFTVKIK